MNAERTVPRQDGSVDRRLDVTCTDGPHGVHLAMKGEIDSALAPIFSACLQSAIADTDGLIVVDLGAVTFMDCSGITALTTAHASADGRLRLGAVHRNVRRVLEITGLLHRFPRSDDSADCRAVGFHRRC